MTHPKKRSNAYLLGFPQNGQNTERIEHLLPEPKTVFDGVSLQRGVKNDPPSNTSNGLGNSKGLREGTRCSVAGGASGKIKALRSQKHPFGGVWSTQGHKDTEDHIMTKSHLPLPLNRGYGGLDRSSFIGRGAQNLDRHLWYHRCRDRLTRLLHTYCCTHRTIGPFRQTGKETLRDMWMSGLTLHLIRKRLSRITGCVTLPMSNLGAV